MQAGKDTVGKLLMHWGYRRIALADKVKETAAQVLDVREDLLRDDRFKDRIEPYWGLTYRELLQIYGMIMRDHFHPDVWVRHVERAIANESSAQKWVITDVRFPNEIDMVRRFRGSMLGVVRPGLPETYDHPTEQLDVFEHCDEVVYNTNLQELELQLANVMGEWA